MTKISVLILDYLKADKVVQNVTSLKKQRGDFTLEIIIVDNSQNPKNAEVLKNHFANVSGVKLCINERNNGYTKGNNQAAHLATGDYLLILNPDIRCTDPQTIETLLNRLQSNPEIGIVGPAQKNPDGLMETTARDWPKLWVQFLRRSYWQCIPGLKSFIARDILAHKNLNIIQAVPWLQSSCILLQRSLWDQIGGLDERYFIFMADTELCYQAAKYGFKTIYDPSVVVQADGVRASRGSFWAFIWNPIIRFHIVDAWRYWRKRRSENFI